VLIVDTDPQASATLGLGIHPDTPARSIYHLYMGKVDSDAEQVSLSDIIVRTSSGIDLVPSHLDLVGAEPALYHYPDRYSILAQEIELIKNRYDHILIDTPPFLGQFLINGLIAAEKIALVFSPDSFAINGYENIRLILNDIEEILGKKISIDLAILNRWTDVIPPLTFFDRIGNIFKNTPQRPDFSGDLRRQLKEMVQRDISRVFEVPQSGMVGVSNQRGQPLAFSFPDDEAGLAYAQIAAYLDNGR
jgi:chromosome partitioning protein